MNNICGWTSRYFIFAAEQHLGGYIHNVFDLAALNLYSIWHSINPTREQSLLEINAECDRKIFQFDLAALKLYSIWYSINPTREQSLLEINDECDRKIFQ